MISDPYLLHSGPKFVIPTSFSEFETKFIPPEPAVDIGENLPLPTRLVLQPNPM